MSKPLCVDLFCGLGGFSEGFLEEGYWCVGFDIERHDYGTGGYPGDLVLQNILTLHGSQFKDAAIIVASPPCQFFSYCAMPWSRAKLLAKVTRLCPLRMEREKSLFNACFRIQKEACEAAGRHIPMVVENVRGAQPWVGRSAWNYGSFHLWGDVPALMPFSRQAKVGGFSWSDYGEPKYQPQGFNVTAAQRFREETGRKTTSERLFKNRRVKRINDPSSAVFLRQEIKGAGGGWFNDNKRKGGTETGYLSQSGSRSSARKAASAQIAKIPFPLSQYIARVYKPQEWGGIAPPGGILSD